MKRMYVYSPSTRTARLTLNSQIRLLEVLLDGSRHGRVNTTQGVGRVDANEAGTFLDTHPTAKIIIIIDAHCLENGAFVWTGNDPVSFQGCYMPEVSTKSLCAMQNLTSQ